MTRIKKVFKKIFKIFGWILFTVTVLVLALLLFVRSPWGQDIVIQKVTAYVAEKTQATFSIDRLFFTFRGNIYIEGLYLEDVEGDTLVYSKNLETGINPVSLIRTGDIDISRVEWDGLVAQVGRDEEGKFNFDFLLEAFTSGESEPDAQTDSVSNGQAGETSNLAITIGPVRFSDFRLIYKDRLMGLDTKFILGKLELDLGTLDLDQMQFHVEHFYFFNSELSYLQTKPFPVSEDTATTETVMPLVVIDDFTIEQVVANYKSTPDGIDAELSLGKFFLNLPEANLNNQKILVKEVSLNDSEVIYHSTSVSGNDTSQYKDMAGNTAEPFSWPDWIVEIGKINLENNRLVLLSDDEVPISGVFNPNAMDFKKLSFKSDNLFLKNQSLGMNLEQFSFEEASGFSLEKFDFALKGDNSGIEIRDLTLETGYSKVAGSINLNYNDVSTLIEYPENMGFNIDLPVIDIGIRDAFYFDPELRNNDYIASLVKKPLNASFMGSGDMERLNLERVQVNWGKTTKLNAKGELRNVADPENLFWDVTDFTFTASRTDILSFVSEDELGIKLPENFNGRMASKGKTESMTAEAILEFSGAKVTLEGNYRETDQLSFGVQAVVEALPLGELIRIEDLGVVSFSLEASGEGEGLSDLNAHLNSAFDQLEIYGYDYKGLELSGDLVDGEGDIKLFFQDENLDMNLQTHLALDSVHSRIQAELELNGADFLALKLSPNDLRARFKMNMDWEGNMEDFKLDTEIESGAIVFEETAYPIGDFAFQLVVEPDSTGFQLNSVILDAFLASNASPEQTYQGISRHFQRYLNDSVETAPVDVPVELKIDMSISSSALLSQVLLPDLEQLAEGRFEVDFSESSQVFDAQLDFPFISYAGLELDSVGFRVNSNPEDFDFSFGLVALDAGPLSLGKTYFNGQVKEEKLFMDFNALENEETLVHIAFDLGMDNDTTRLHLDPENLVLNKREWEIPEGNRIEIAPEHLQFSEFVLTRNNQYLTISNEVEGTEAPHVGVVFKEFRLGTFTSLLNPDELLAAGQVNGKLILENPFGAKGIVADIEVADLNVMETALGNLSLEAKSRGESAYDFNMHLKEGGIDLDLAGNYVADEAGANLDLDLDLNRVDMKVIEGLSADAISDAEGNISGHFKVQGTTVDPNYVGVFNFNQTAFTVTTLNTRFKLSEQEINLDNKGVYLENFTINDRDDHIFRLDGNILTADLANPTFDLNLYADDFTVLNSTREDNDLFYGNANIDADVQIRGDLNLPRVNAKLGVNKGTDLTFIVPESQLDVVEREGVVLFVNRQDPDDILTRREAEMTSAGFTGYQVAATLNVSPDAIFNVVVDERSGDNLEVAGEANLKLNLDPNGRVTLAGNYEVRKGHYEMSLYNLVSRRFEFEEGSTLDWSGDPMDARLNLTAIYQVRTSAAELMAASAAAGSRESMGQYRQELPFMVFLNIQGELLRPEISFRLDMPEEQRGAIGGSVYSQVQQLNNQEGELNRQVFSLLVLNRFFPEGGSEGGGGTTALARSSVSQMLSGQLNTLSDNLFGDSGLELDMDLDSFRDYQGASPQDRTQLNVSARKRFMDDRLVVQVGSQIDIEGGGRQDMGSGNALLGNVSVEYLLTENGRYRIRGFRKNEFESIIDGQLLITGLSVIFNRDFNRFLELWKGIEIQRNGGLPEDEKKLEKQPEGQPKDEVDEN